MNFMVALLKFGIKFKTYLILGVEDFYVIYGTT